MAEKELTSLLCLKEVGLSALYVYAIEAYLNHKRYDCGTHHGLRYHTFLVLWK